ncbi:DUF4238 domain-containing protein [Chelativorans salis]|uniref:DUF4238 domain-containing protein n=1 Tax=Chelativorans salis TaxID=2978478 RepID=A0ABT2LP44_9HYPH|nr:DUF4238 domain-containing protein [Chelativorans sp. EGI FJ00035]MCT7376327.1 DUF4238 domain-containing protein [Chelativorans sp. EGI FJ00035]
MTPANPPTKHHFIPAFYLRRWENNTTGKLTEYSNPYQRKIAVKPVTAERTGYEERLYELKGYEPTLAQQVEETFFKPVDTWASNSLDMLEAHGHYAPWDNQSRSAWSRFILSLLLRCPEDIAMFREWWHEDFSATDAEAEARYQAVREPSDPETFSEYLAGQPLAKKERHQFDVFYTLVDHENVGSTLNGMHWRVLQTVPHAPTLLTSDRPVIRTPLGAKDAHVVLPIGPRQIWIGGSDADFLEQVRLADPVRLVKEVNRQVVEGAKWYVWGADASHLRFVENRFGRNPQPRLMESVVARRRAAVAAK